MPLSPDRPEIEHAVAVLRAGGLVALPTETVYGLAADAANELAVRRVFAVKGRPASHPVIVHIAGAAALDEWARDVPDAARRLAAAFWPGPLTLVLPRSERALDVVTGGQDTVALRAPDHPVALAVLRAFGGGLAAPSANRFGHVSPTTAEHVRADLGADVDLVLDGGPCAIGVESTIVDLASDPAAPVILRTGAIGADDVARVLGVAVRVAAAGTDAGGVRAPGMLAAHYAPRAGVELVSADEAGPRAAALAGGPARRIVLVAPPGVAAPALGPGQRIDAPADPGAFAQRLYAMLREADARGAEVALVVPPPESGLGVAVRDRLRRAAGGRG
jgi:L-threonylcarbamoyladenylate synthase